MTPRDEIIRSGESTECLNCTRRSITHRITYPDIPEHLVIKLCPRCSPFLEGYPLDEFEVQLHGNESIRADEEFKIDLILTNTQSLAKNVAVGGALRFGNFYEARFGSTKVDTVDAGGSFTHTFTGTIPSSAPPNDLHAFQIFCLVDGRISMLSKPLWRITPDLETTRDRPASRERPGEGDETEQLRRLIGAAVAAVLKVPTVSTHANFIDLGVTSLSLVTLHARLKRNSAPTSRSAG